MKKLLFTALFALSAWCVSAQTQGETFYIYHEGNITHSFLRAKVDSITFSTYDMDSIQHADYVTQLVWMRDTLYRLSLASIDSVSLRQPSSEAVDLGLSVLWATRNVGAATTDDFGGLYGWADPTGEKTSSSADDYPSSTPPDAIGGTSNDIARVRWGGQWRTPNYLEVQELVNKCTFTWTAINNVKGALVTGPNGNTIFLPASGRRDVDDIDFRNSAGYYWSATHDKQHASGGQSFGMFFNDGNKSRGHYGREYGLSVRPVKNK